MVVTPSSRILITCLLFSSYAIISFHYYLALQLTHLYLSSIHPAVLGLLRWEFYSYRMHVPDTGRQQYRDVRCRLYVRCFRVLVVSVTWLGKYHESILFLALNAFTTPAICS